MEKRPRFSFGEVNEFAGWDNNANYGMHVVEILTRKGPRIGQLRDDPVQPGLPMGKMMLRELHTHTHTPLHLPTPLLFPGIRLTFSFLKNPFAKEPDRSPHKKGKMNEVALKPKKNR